MAGLSRAEKILFAGIMALFLFFAIAWISLPGPQQDELLHLDVLLPALRPAVFFSLKTHEHRLPLMVMSYVGALKGWLLWLWFQLVPMGVAGYRTFGIAVGVAIVFLIFRFVRQHYGPVVALLTTGLVATDPTFVHTIRIDYGPVALAHLFKMGGLCALSAWLKSGERRSLTGGMFLFGLGLWDKANFIWFLAGLAATVVLLFPREALARVRSDIRIVPIAILGLAIGASPLIGYNWKRHNETLRERGQLEIRWSKLNEARVSMDGRYMVDMTSGGDQFEAAPLAHGIALPGLANWMYRISVRDTITVALLGLALLLLPLNLWITDSRRVVLFPLVLSLLTYLCMFVTHDGGSSAHHVIMLQPFPMLFLAVSLWTPTERWPVPLTRTVPVLVALAAIAVNIGVNARHLAAYTRTGGTRAFSDAAYRLVPYLGGLPGRKLYAMDWGFSNPIMFLGARQGLRVDDIFSALAEPADPDHAKNAAWVAGLMRDSNNLFLLHSPQRTFFPAPATEFFALANAGIPMRQVAYFEERTGELVYEVYQYDEKLQQTPAEREVEVRFSQARVKPGQEYGVEVKEFPDAWIDVVYHVDQDGGKQVSSGTSARFCRLDAEGRARVKVPAGHPAATVSIVRIRPSGGRWRLARGSITVSR